jgi:RNA recognition motif-containing protein
VLAETSDEDIRAMFEPFGTIKQMKVVQTDMGKYGFVCYEDPKNKDHGNEAVTKAVEGLKERVMGEKDGKELKLYVREFLNAPQRAQEKFQEMIRYKNSKKRCNLYVKNFPAEWSEENLNDLFRQYGEIERVKLEKGTGKNTYAFVCFKKPDACSQAKASLQGQTFDGKGLVINHYEIKEIRDLQLEEIRDKRDWEKYINSLGNTLAWSQLSNQPHLTHIIQQLLSLMQQQGPQGGPDMR